MVSPAEEAPEDAGGLEWVQEWAAGRRAPQLQMGEWTECRLSYKSPDPQRSRMQRQDPQGGGSV